MDSTKKVIFVGGTAYSGSTLLDMVLANDPKGYSLGEIYALFKPWRKHHFEEIEKLKKDNIWSNIISNGTDKLYLSLFKYFPNIDFFVDSSKNPIWIRKQSEILRKQDIRIFNVLIYKNPEELAHSFDKRNELDNLERSIKTYYSLYFNLIDNFIPVSYKGIIEKSVYLERLCHILDLNYFETKIKFWLKNDYNTFFGNNRTRVHTSQLQSLGVEKVSNLDSEGKKTIYYNVSTNNKINSLAKELEKKYYEYYKLLYENELKIINLSKQHYSFHDRFFILSKYLQYHTRGLLNFTL